MQRFRQEARVASSLNQPNILTIFEFGEVSGLVFLATEFIDGETLRRHLRDKRLKLPEILDIATQILAALDAAHEARIVHRDIKPENVMIRRRDHVVKVLDFGLAKVTEKRATLATEQTSEAATEMKTAPGMLMGTINYMAPEQAQSRAVDERTDIWSTGVMLYEMVTGAMPFGGPTASHTLVQIIENEPAPLTKAAAHTPIELQRIIKKAMAKEPDDRYQTARDMLIDLRSLRKQLDAGPAVLERRDPAADKRRALLVALVVLLFFIAAILSVNVWRRSRVRSPAPLATTPNTTPVAPIDRRALTYWITVRQRRDGKQKVYTVAGEINFELKDEIRLNVRSPAAGHLYVLNEGPGNGSAIPEFVVLFPSPTANEGSSQLQVNSELQIPATSWFTFDQEQGVERVWLIFSKDALPEFEALKQFASAQTGGLITDPAQNKLVQEFLSTHSTDKPAAEKGNTLTTVSTTERVLVYALKLQHH
jgi:serine/threonine protein kinase